MMYEFSPAPFWRTRVFPYSTDHLLAEISSTLCRFNQAQDLSLMAEYTELNRYMYLRECLVAEKNIGEEYSVDMIEHVTSSPDLTKRDHVKIVNMFSAYRSLETQRIDMDEFTPSLAKKIHKQVCNGLVTNAGEYRTKSAKPAGEYYWYVEPDDIETKVGALFSSTRLLLASLGTNYTAPVCAQKIKIVASFLSAFLIIHPFSNGNGRVARLLCSNLLLDVTIVPLSITEPRLRGVYLDCLRDVQVDSYRQPTLLATLLLERIWKSLEDARVTVLE